MRKDKLAHMGAAAISSAKLRGCAHLPKAASKEQTLRSCRQHVIIRCLVLCDMQSRDHSC
jgi:hypothetical protein